MFKKFIRDYHFPVAAILFVVLFIAVSVSYGFKGEITGKVMQVKDGDTIVVSPVEGGSFFVCRFYGIDAPETAKRGKPGQPYGEEATRELKKLVLGQTVEVVTSGAKTYNREVCVIYKDKTNVNLEMVKRGYAWAYRQYLRRPYASEYIDAEREARAKRLGLWQQANPQPPWEFRKANRYRKAIEGC